MSKIKPLVKKGLFCLAVASARRQIYPLAKIRLCATLFPMGLDNRPPSIHSPGVVRRDKLIWAREKRGMGVDALADRLKISRQTVYRIEKGTRAPSHGIMIRWARELDAPLDIFNDEIDSDAA